jgi:hypothetical protein
MLILFIATLQIGARAGHWRHVICQSDIVSPVTGTFSGTFSHLYKSGQKIDNPLRHDRAIGLPLGGGGFDGLQSLRLHLRTECVDGFAWWFR